MHLKPDKNGLMIADVDASDNGLRVDLFVSRVLGGVPRKRLSRLFDEKAVRLSGRCVAKGTLLKEGDRVEFPAGPFPSESVTPDPRVKFKVIFKNDGVAVVEKPAGIPSHPNNPVETGTLANGLVHKWPSLIGVGVKPLEPGMVHRLDTGTSGLMIVAMSDDAFAALRKAFTSGDVRKGYLAVVEGAAPESGEIDRPLAHDARDARVMRVAGVRGVRCRGKAWPAATRFRRISIQGKFTLIEIYITGGVMHQIRAHMSFLGFPVVGDSLYGSASTVGDGREFLLHASRLSFTDPITDEAHDFRSEKPSRFGLFLSKHG